MSDGADHAPVVWITGPSPCDAAAVAERVATKLRRRRARVELIDHSGAVLWPEVREAQQEAHVRRVGSLAEMLSRQGVTVVTAVPAPQRALRDEVRGWLGARFVEVYLAAPGASEGYEPPHRPELTLRDAAPDAGADRVLAHLDGVPQPAGAAAGGGALDFLVIGVQKGGTTSLWQHLRGHPRIRLPEDKEAPIFAGGADVDRDAVERLLSSYFHGAPPDALLGTVTPHYMMGHEGISAERIAERIATLLPHVRLIALLRDPIERAVSHWRMSVRRALESRTFEAAAHELLDPAWLTIAREQPTETNAYLAQGEYGRVLGAYRAHVPAERLLVAYTAELAREPGAVLDRVLAFLGLEPGFRPEGLATHHHRGGMRRRIDEDGERQLRGLLAAEVWPRLGAQAEPAIRAFNYFLETWNVIPDEERPAVDPATRVLLEAHFARDAEQLAALGIAAPWLAAWSTGPISPAPAPGDPLPAA